MQSNIDCFKATKKSSGFTLIEIMIAMVIVSVGVVSVMGAVQVNAQIASELDRKLIANWVVSNRFAEIRHDSKLKNVSAGKDSESIKMGGYEWSVRATIEESELDRVFVVTVEAFDKNDDKTPVTSMTSSVADKL